MTTEVLKTLISEMIIRELTARQGPRTGGFEFEPQTIQQVINLFVVNRKKIDQMATNSPKGYNQKFPTEKTIVPVKSPINGKVYKIPFLFYWDVSDKALVGSFQGYWSERGRIELNLAVTNKVPMSNVHSTIIHELTHLFDKQLFNKRKQEEESQDKEEVSYDGEEHYGSDYEKKAYTNEFIWIMTQYAQKLAERTSQKMKIETMVSKELVKSPWKLLDWGKKQNIHMKHIMDFFESDGMKERHPDFIKNLHKSCYDIVQAYIVPSLS